jgi:hypothetical protein
MWRRASTEQFFCQFLEHNESCAPGMYVRFENLGTWASPEVIGSVGLSTPFETVFVFVRIIPSFHYSSIPLVWWLSREFVRIFFILNIEH